MIRALIAVLVLASCNVQPVAPRPERREPPAVPNAVPAVRALDTAFAALDDDDATIPPGPSGAVGPAHLVAIAGSQLRIQTKTGAIVATQSVASLFASLGHTTHAAGRVVYDPAGHWIVVANADAGAAIEIAVSVTSDPTGAFHAYDLPVTVADAANVRVGFNHDRIAISADLVDHTTKARAGVRIYACDKAALYAGTGTCHANDRGLALGDYQVEPALTYDDDTDEILVERDTGTDVRILQIAGAIGSEFISSVGFPNGFQAWSSSGAVTNQGFAQQAGTLERIDTGDDRIASAVVRNHHVFAAQTVYLPAANPTRTAIQWFEIDGYSIIQGGRIEDPTNALDYAYPTIAVNSHDDVMIAFAKLGAAISPSAGYASRMHGDNPGELSPEMTFRAGAGAYAKTHGGAMNRWGGAGGAAVDPSDGETLWALAAVSAAPDPPPCMVDCGNWTTAWAALSSGCTGQANGAPCDTDLCHDGSQTCSAGACTGGTPTTCGAQGECVAIGICVPATGCPQTSAPDGTPCTEGECEGGTCQHYADDFPFFDDIGDPIPDGPRNPTTGPGGGGGGGCCETGGGGAGSALLALGVLVAARRRRR